MKKSVKITKKVSRKLKFDKIQTVSFLFYKSGSRRQIAWRPGAVPIIWWGGTVVLQYSTVEYWYWAVVL